MNTTTPSAVMPTGAKVAPLGVWVRASPCTREPPLAGLASVGEPVDRVAPVGGDGEGRGATAEAGRHAARDELIDMFG